MMAWKWWLLLNMAIVGIYVKFLWLSDIDIGWWYCWWKQRLALSLALNMLEIQLSNGNIVQDFPKKSKIRGGYFRSTSKFVGNSGPYHQIPMCIFGWLDASLTRLLLAQHVFGAEPLGESSRGDVVEMEGAGWVFWQNMGEKGNQCRVFSCYELFMPHFVCWKYVAFQISAEFADIHTAFL